MSAIGSASPNHRHVLIARGCTPGHDLELDDYEDCEPVVIDVPDVRRELKAGRTAPESGHDRIVQAPFADRS